ncbi:MAG: methyltransferase domain-containing protein [Candidatus Bathyarchaeia archaeon]
MCRYDISREAVTIAKVKLATKDYVDLLVADAENIPFKDNSFDVVFSADVVEHLCIPSKGIKEIVRIGRDKIVIATPNKLCPIDMSKVAQILTHHNPPPIEKYLTRFQLRKMLQNAGLNPEDVQIFESSFFPLGWLLVHVKLQMSLKLFKIMLIIEDFLERTPLRYIAGVIVALGRKKDNKVI